MMVRVTAAVSNRGGMMATVDEMMAQEETYSGNASEEQQREGTKEHEKKENQNPRDVARAFGARRGCSRHGGAPRRGNTTWVTSTYQPCVVFEGGCLVFPNSRDIQKRQPAM